MKGPRSETIHHERLYLPWWLWPVTITAALFAAAELTLGAGGRVSVGIHVALVSLALLALWSLGRIRIDVVPGELRVDDARLPLSAIVAVEALDAGGRRLLLGALADPLAFVIQRPFVAGGVRIDLDDPADPTPYWFVSSRHPQQLAAALDTARHRSPGR